MLKGFNLFYAFLGFIFLSSINPLCISNANSNEALKVELKKELEQGNFLIGLKQYLGGKNDGFSINKKITFVVDKGFINLHSLNGIKHKSQRITIFWKDLPLKTPYSVERFVFGPYASYESAKQQSSILKKSGLDATVVFPQNWEVWVALENNLLKSKFKDKLSTKIYNYQVTPFLVNEDSLLKLDGPIYISSDQEIKINNINFGKKFYLAKDLYGTWTLIQKIKFDDYLEGVLPYEIGANAPFEALKAQAVIARTWAIYNSERFKMDQYHLCITTQCQVYKSPKIKSKDVSQAIKETSNLIITFRNRPINSFYHGSNGGIFAKSSESWNIVDFPYFKTVIDGSDSLEASFKLPMRSKSELKNFLAFDTKNFYGSKHYLFRWNKKVVNSIIEDYLIKNKLIDADESIVDLKVIERGASGRVTKLEIKINDSNKSVFILKDDIRKILSFLPSNLFIINKINDNLWLFRGGGFGHGVGLSQSGAIEMAELGFTYEQILNHYYQGTKLQHIEIQSQ